MAGFISSVRGVPLWAGGGKSLDAQAPGKACQAIGIGKRYTVCISRMLVVIVCNVKAHVLAAGSGLSPLHSLQCHSHLSLRSHNLPPSRSTRVFSSVSAFAMKFTASDVMPVQQVLRGPEI